MLGVFDHNSTFGFSFQNHVPRYFSFLGFCLLALSINFGLMEYNADLMVVFPLKIIDYTILFASLLMVEVIDLSLIKGKQH